jgi:hypothetical protein
VATEGESQNPGEEDESRRLRLACRWLQREKGGGGRWLKEQEDGEGDLGNVMK